MRGLAIDSKIGPTIGGSRSRSDQGSTKDTSFLEFQSLCPIRAILDNVSTPFKWIKASHRLLLDRKTQQSWCLFLQLAGWVDLMGSSGRKKMKRGMEKVKLWGVVGKVI